MRRVQAGEAEDDTLNVIKIGTSDDYNEADIANELLLKIAKAARVPTDHTSLNPELENLKKDSKTVEVTELEQVISFRSCMDAFACVTKGENQYTENKVGLVGHFLPPLKSFYCPITQDVMENPVEIASGQTFEMSAIQKWFAEGHKVCPVTKIKLESLSVRPNRLLKQSIEEWKDRNTILRISALSPRLKSENEEEVIEALHEIQELCEAKSICKYWLGAEGLIPLLGALLGSSKCFLRKKSLATLTIVLSDNAENRSKFCNAGGIKYAVHSLARDAGEARQAVALLLELAKDEGICSQISKVQGCILLVVTMVNSENTYAVADAKKLLTLFSMSTDNVMRMTEVNYLKPLVQHLYEGLSLSLEHSQMDIGYSVFLWCTLSNGCKYDGIIESCTL